VRITQLTMDNDDEDASDAEDSNIDIVLPMPDDRKYLLILGLIFEQSRRRVKDMRTPALTDVFNNIKAASSGQIR
jgi:hypothetical protein